MNVFFENKFENKIITRDSNFLIDENGNHPKPLDLICSEDINKKWFVKDKKYQEQADEWVRSKYSQGKFFVIIDFQKKVKIRPGYERFGAENTALTPIRNAWTWWTSTGFQAPQRFYGDELEIYLGTVDGYAINAWTRVLNGWSATEKLRPATWFDATEGIDLQIMVQGDDNLYEWNGAVAVVSSITGTTITKKGTTTFAQNRFYTIF